MTDETTTEQLAEIEGQSEDTPATGYTPPDGWRVLAVGERLRDGDVTVRRDGYQYPTERVGGWVGSNQRYIRPIEPQPQAEPEPEPLPDTDEKIRRLQSRINELETINAARDLIVADADRQNTELRSELEKANTKVEELQSERDEALYDLSQMGERFTQEEIDLLMVIRRCQKEEQIGGTHYQGTKLQPVTISVVNNLGFIEGNILKYLLRHREKGGRESLEKALNYLKRLISISYPDGPESKG